MRESVRRCAFGDGIIHKDEFAPACVIRGCQQHALTRYVADPVGFEIDDDQDLFAREFFGVVVVFDAGHDRSFLQPVKQGQFQAGS